MGWAREGGKDRKGGRKRRGIETEKGREKDVFQLKGFSLMARCDCERKSREIKSLCRGLKAQGEERDHIERRAYSRMYGEIKTKVCYKHPSSQKTHHHTTPSPQRSPIPGNLYSNQLPPIPIHRRRRRYPRRGTYNICALVPYHSVLSSISFSTHTSTFVGGGFDTLTPHNGIGCVIYEKALGLWFALNSWFGGETLAAEGGDWCLVLCFWIVCV